MIRPRRPSGTSAGVGEVGGLRVVFFCVGRRWVKISDIQKIFVTKQNAEPKMC